MKLALVRRHFSATGGAELYAQRLLAALAARGHELHLFADAWEAPLAGVTLHPIKSDASRATRALTFARTVQRELAGQAFDCVFSLERTLQQDVYRAGDGVHRVWLDRRRQFAPWWKKPFVSRAAFHQNLMNLEGRTYDPQNTRHIIVNSDMVRREIIEHFSFPADRLHLVRNGVDVARFQTGRRAETRDRFGIKPTDFLLLFVGSGWERKGLRFVTAAWRHCQPTLPEVKLLVVGRDRPPATPPAGVRFEPPMNDLENAYAAADLLVFPPVYEPSANVVIEALAAGLPVVTSPNNGAAEILQENVTGNVVTRFWQPEALFQAILPWVKNRRRVQVAPSLLSLDRNVSETLAVLELAARERSK